MERLTLADFTPYKGAFDYTADDMFKAYCLARRAIGDFYHSEYAPVIDHDDADGYAALEMMRWLNNPRKDYCKKRVINTTRRAVYFALMKRAAHETGTLKYRGRFMSPWKQRVISGRRTFTEMEREGKNNKILRFDPVSHDNQRVEINDLIEFVFQTAPPELRQVFEALRQDATEIRSYKLYSSAYKIGMNRGIWASLSRWREKFRRDHESVFNLL